MEDAGRARRGLGRTVLRVWRVSSVDSCVQSCLVRAAEAEGVSEAIGKRGKGASASPQRHLVTARFDS